MKSSSGRTGAEIEEGARESRESARMGGGGDGQAASAFPQFVKIREIRVTPPLRLKKFDTNCTNFHEFRKSGWPSVRHPFSLIRVHLRDSRALSAFSREQFDGAFGECALPGWWVPRERGGKEISPIRANS
jgi:hypothetical protein